MIIFVYKRILFTLLAVAGLAGIALGKTLPMTPKPNAVGEKRADAVPEVVVDTVANPGEPQLPVVDPSGAREIAISVNTQYQEIDNFGASGAWTATGVGKYWSKAKKNEAATLLFSQEMKADGSPKGIGLSAWRFNIGGGSALPTGKRNGKHALGGPRGRWGHDNWRSAECFKYSEKSAIDPKAQEGGIWFLKKAQEMGVEDLIGFVNSPPFWLTYNEKAHHGDLSSVTVTNHKGGVSYKPRFSSNLPDDKHGDFANFLVEVIKHLRDREGIQLDYISPINEPTWAWVNNGVKSGEDLGGNNQEGCPYNNEQLKSVVEKLYDALQREGLGEVFIDGPDAVEYPAILDPKYTANTEFWDNQSDYSGGMNKYGLGDYKQYLKLFLEDPEFSEKVHNTVSVHGYWADYTEDRLTTLRELVLQNKNEYNPDAKIWMSEVCGMGTGPLRDWSEGRYTGKDMTRALHWSRTIHYDLTRMNASAWHWWTAISSVEYDDGLLFTSVDFTRSDTSDETLYETKQLWALGNFSRFIRPGFKRVKLDGADEMTGLKGSAYISENDKRLVVVFINHNDTNEKVNLTGVDSYRNFKVYVTDENHDLAYMGETAHKLSIPKKAVVTLVAEKGAESPSSQ
jgi:O-glycosyl hydrolase